MRLTIENDRLLASKKKQQFPPPHWSFGHMIRNYFHSPVQPNKFRPQFRPSRPFVTEPQYRPRSRQQLNQIAFPPPLKAQMQKWPISNHANKKTAAKNEQERSLINMADSAGLTALHHAVIATQIHCLKVGDLHFTQIKETFRSVPQPTDFTGNR